MKRQKMILMIFQKMKILSRTRKLSRTFKKVVGSFFWVIFPAILSATPQMTEDEITREFNHFFRLKPDGSHVNLWKVNREVEFVGSDYILRRIHIANGLWPRLISFDGHAFDMCPTIDNRGSNIRLLWNLKIKSSIIKN